MARLSPAEAAKLLAKRRAKAFQPSDLLDQNFPQQTEFILDSARLKALFCTRRAAKSYTAGLNLAYEALSHPGVNCLFLGLTRASSKGIIWKDILKQINRKYKLGAAFNATELTMTFPNGSVIYVTGADADEDEMNKLLGRKYRLVTIDEASMFTIDVYKLVYGVLKPAMTDNGGSICMMGTSSNFARGLFHSITIGIEPGWKLFSWSAHDNPYVRDQWAQELADIDKDRPLFKETNLYKQWYLNLWAVDEDKKVYKFKEERNTYKDLPVIVHEDWVYVLGIDTGWEDDNAFVLTAYNAADKNLYVVKTYNKPHMTFDQVVEKTKEFINDRQQSPVKIIIDGANKQGVESMRSRSNIPFEYAEKQGKVDFIEMLNGDLIQQKIKVHTSCTKLIYELNALVWATDGEKIRYPKQEHPALPNHLCDAFLYAWRCGFHYAFQTKPVEPAKGSPEWAKREEDTMRENLYNQVRKEEAELNQTDWYTQQEVIDTQKWRRG